MQITCSFSSSGKAGLWADPCLGNSEQVEQVVTSVVLGKANKASDENLFDSMLGKENDSHSR